MLAVSRVPVSVVVILSSCACCEGERCPCLDGPHLRLPTQGSEQSRARVEKKTEKTKLGSSRGETCQQALNASLGWELTEPRTLGVEGDDLDLKTCQARASARLAPFIETSRCWRRGCQLPANVIRAFFSSFHGEPVAPALVTMLRRACRLASITVSPSY